jgi:hypothetical protein
MERGELFTQGDWVQPQVATNSLTSSWRSGNCSCIVSRTAPGPDLGKAPRPLPKRYHLTAYWCAHE